MKIRERATGGVLGTDRAGPASDASTALPASAESFAGYPPVPSGAPARSEGAPKPAPNQVNMLATFALARAAAASIQDLVTEHPVTESNGAEILFGGERAFPRIFADLRGAQRVINISTFALTRDGVGGELIAILEERARAGVEVNVIADALGSRLALLPGHDGHTREAVSRLRAAGARVHVNRILEFNGRGALNNVEHRKIVTIDGAIAYTGGMGFQETYQKWHDCMVRYTGPVVQQIQIEFLKTWIYLGYALVPPAGSNDEWRVRYFPEAQPVTGGIRARVASQIPGVSKQVSQAYIRELRALAEGDAMWIANPYVVDETLIQEMINAAQRRAAVNLIVPGSNDHSAVHFASRSQYDRMIEAGVRLYEWPGMLHMKVAASSRGWSGNGSFNFDALSIHHLREVLVESDSPRAARDMMDRLEADAKRSREVKQGEVGVLTRFAGALAKELLGGVM